jgi:hypothetical protein
MRMWRYPVATSAYVRFASSRSPRVIAKLGLGWGYTDRRHNPRHSLMATMVTMAAAAAPPPVPVVAVVGPGHQQRGGRGGGRGRGILII